MATPTLPYFQPLPQTQNATTDNRQFKQASHAHAMSTQPQEPTRYQRIEANCKKIWGAHKYFDIDIETDDYEYYLCVVKEDHGLSFSPPMTMITLFYGGDRALDELDRMLRLWATQVEGGRPMSMEEQLEIFSGPRGEHRWVLEEFVKKVDEKEAAGAAGKA